MKWKNASCWKIRTLKQTLNLVTRLAGLKYSNLLKNSSLPPHWVKKAKTSQSKKLTHFWNRHLIAYIKKQASLARLILEKVASNEAFFGAWLFVGDREFLIIFENWVEISDFYRFVPIFPDPFFVFWSRWVRINFVFRKFGSNSPVLTYQFTTLVFGEICASSAAVQTLQRAANDNMRFPHVATKLKDNF